VTPVGDPFAARIYLAPQWDPSGKVLVVAAALPDESAQPYRVRSVKSTDTRIPGDQFFTDERKAILSAIDVASGVSTALTTPVVLRSFRLSPTGRHAIYVAPVRRRSASSAGAERRFRPADRPRRGNPPAPAVKSASAAASLVARRRTVVVQKGSRLWPSRPTAGPRRSRGRPSSSP
jgi:hypothetical protein